LALVALAFRAVDLCFRGPLASCAPGRVPCRLRLPTASTRSGSGHPSGFAGSRRGRSLSGTTCSVGSGAVFRPVPLPSPAPEGAGWSGSRPEGHAPVPLPRSLALLAPKSVKIRRTPCSEEREDPKSFRAPGNPSGAAARSLSAETESLPRPKPRGSSSRSQKIACRVLRLGGSFGASVRRPLLQSLVPGAPKLEPEGSAGRTRRF
jgi:hypothetical protein